VTTKLRQLFIITTGLAVLAAAKPARAVLVNLENLSGPSTFAAVCGSSTACSQTITEHTAGGDVTLDGGVILTNTTSLPANESTVYGSMSNDYIGSSANLGNPITITFSQPVTGFMVDVINGLTTEASYQIADNLGNVVSFTLASNAGIGATTIGFLTAGTFVTITSLSSETTYDMLIDDIRFNVPMTCSISGCRELVDVTATEVPEPVSTSLLGARLAIVTLQRRRRRT